jgi:hypothetical protein
MKRFYVLIFSLVIAGLANGQEFVFKINFKDAKGNRDSIILGYDKIATVMIDSLFGEQNIINKPLDSSFDVRVSNMWNFYSFSGRDFNDSFYSDSFQTKKQIIPDSCGKWFRLITIDIFCKNWPVQATWDSSLFKRKCVQGSLLASVNPGGWWDTGSPSDLFRLGFANANKRTFTANFNSKDFNSNYAYINNKGDTVSVFWQAFGDSSLIIMGVDSLINSPFQVYPNPTNGLLKISGSMEKVDCINLFELTGRLVTSTKNDYIDLKGCKKGIYVVSIKLKNGKMLNYKIINTR